MYLLASLDSNLQDTRFITSTHNNLGYDTFPKNGRTSPIPQKTTRHKHTFICKISVVSCKRLQQALYDTLVYVN